MHERKQIAQTIEDMGEGLTIVMECLDSLLSQLLAREELSAADEARLRSTQPLITFSFSHNSTTGAPHARSPSSLHEYMAHHSVELGNRILVSYPPLHSPEQPAVASNGAIASPTLSSTSFGNHGRCRALEDCARCARRGRVRSGQDP